MTTDAATHHAHHPNYVKSWAILSGLLLVSVTGPMVGIRVVTLIAAFGVALLVARTAGAGASVDAAGDDGRATTGGAGAASAGAACSGAVDADTPLPPLPFVGRE